MTSVEVVDFRDTLGVKLVAVIAAAGYTPSLSTGMPISVEAAAEHYSGSVGLLIQDPRDLPERYFFGLLRRPARMRLVAVIWTDNAYRKATPKRWVVETSGREDLERVTKIVKELAKQFNARALVQLLSDRPSYEMRLSDYDY